MKQGKTLIYEAIFKRFVLSVLLLITISVVSGGIGYYETYPVNYFLAILIFFMVFSTAVVYIIPINYVKKLIKFYFIFLIVCLFPITVFYLSKGIATALFWYFPIPIFIYTVYSHMKAIRWSLFCLGLMLLAFVLAPILRYNFYEDEMAHLSYKHLFYADLINGCAALLMVYICLYYLHKFRELRKSQLLDSVSGAYQENADNLLEVDSDEEYKYRQIYAQIEEYFQNKQPYLDADFKMTQMAHELNINIVYLAKAIRLMKDMNFNNFVNSYRIERVKELMQSNSKKYTLKYIHLSSGFKNQSSFNKAFKSMEGITPSEYYRQNGLDKEE